MTVRTAHEMRCRLVRGPAVAGLPKFLVLFEQCARAPDRRAQGYQAGDHDAEQQAAARLRRMQSLCELALRAQPVDDQPTAKPAPPGPQHPLAEKETA